MDAGPSTVTTDNPIEPPPLDTFISVLNVIGGLDPCPLSLEDKNSLRSACRATRASMNAALRGVKVEWGPTFDEFCEWELAPQMPRVLINHPGEDDHRADTPERARRLGTLAFAALASLNLEMWNPDCLKALCSAPLVVNNTSLRSLTLACSEEEHNWGETLTEALSNAHWPNIEFLSVFLNDSIGLDWDGGESKNPKESAPPILSAASRFTSLRSLTLQCWYSVHDAAALAESSMKHLTKLVLTMPAIELNVNRLPRGLIAADFITLDGGFNSQLRSLQLEDFEFPTTHPLSNLCGGLTSLELYRGLWQEGELASVLGSATCLESLKLEGIPARCLSEMNGMQLAALRELHVSGFYVGGRAGQPVVEIEADFPNLTALHFNAHALEESSEEGPLGHLPVSVHFLPATQSGRCPLPALQTLALVNVYHGAFCGDDFTSIASHLVSLKLSCTHVPDWLTHEYPCLVDFGVYEDSGMTRMFPTIVDHFYNTLFEAKMPSLRRLQLHVARSDYADSDTIKWVTVAPQLLSAEAAPLPSLQEFKCRGVSLGPIASDFLNSKFPRLKISLL